MAIKPPELVSSSGAVSSVFGRTGAITSANNDYTASQVANVATGNIVATTVQAAINELDTEKAPLADPDFTGDVTLNVSAPVQTSAGGKYFSVRGDTAAGFYETSTAAADANGVRLGGLQFVDRNSTSTGTKANAFIGSATDGTTANKRGGTIEFATKADNADDLTERARFNATGQLTKAKLSSATTPDYAFTGDENTGVRSSGADTLNLTTGGTDQVTVASTGIVTFAQAARGPNGSQSAPTWSFTNDTGTGFYRLLASSIGVSLGGTVTWLMNTTTMGHGGSGPQMVTTNTAAAPAFSMAGDSDTGMYLPAANKIGFSTNGTNRMSIDASGYKIMEGGLTNAVDDAAASAAGVPVNGLYRIGSVVMIRVS